MRPKRKIKCEVWEHTQNVGLITILCYFSFYFSVCETLNYKYRVEDDIADCHVDNQEVCSNDASCPKIPKTSCVITRRNVTREFPEYQVSGAGNHQHEANHYAVAVP